MIRCVDLKLEEIFDILESGKDLPLTAAIKKPPRYELGGFERGSLGA